jgi:hypothetical protein
VASGERKKEYVAERRGGLQWSVVDILRGGCGWNRAIGVEGRGVLNAEVKEDTEGRSRGDGTEMSIGKHGRG